MENTCFDCGSREFAHRIEKCARNREDVTLFGVDYIALPVDAEGVQWRIGDVIAWPDGSGLKSVIGIGKDWLFYVDSECEYKADWTVANDKHHAPTVEDVLRDYASRILIVGCIDEEDELVAEFAAKLRLAGDE